MMIRHKKLEMLYLSVNQLIFVQFVSIINGLTLFNSV